MMLFTASDARRHFGQLLDAAQREPVTITKNGRSVAVMLSASDDSMIAALEGFLEVRYWGEKMLRLGEAAMSAFRRVAAY